MNDHEWHLLLDRYIAGECSPAEEVIVGQELAGRDESLVGIDALRRAHARVVEIERPTSRWDPTSAKTTGALARLDQRLADAGLRPVVAPHLRLRLEGARSVHPARRWFGLASGLRVAAVAVLLLGGTAVAVWLGGRPARSADGSTAAMRAFVTSRGQRAVFRLIDGTEVVLGVDSRLRVPTSYGATRRRDVYLLGEAYFTVVHDGAHPFAVHTANGVARDVGTKFGVRAYREDTAAWIVVAEGTVAVAGPASTTGERLVRAGQLAVVSPTGAIAVADGVDVGRELAWTRGELQFSSTPLGAVVRRLGQWYDIDVQLADSALADRPVSGVYADEPLDQVLTLITAAVGAGFKRDDKRVSIFSVPGGS